MITEFHAQMDAPRPTWPDTVRVTVWFSEISTLKAHVDFLMDAPSGHRFATGTSTWLIMDAAGRTPFRCPELLELMALYDEPDAIRHPRFPFTDTGEEIHTATHAVSASDIDFNGHVSNQIYVRLVTSMAASLFSKARLQEMHVKFERECFLGDLLTISLKQSASGDLSAAIGRHGGRETVCRMCSRLAPRPAAGRPEKPAFLVPKIESSGQKV